MKLTENFTLEELTRSETATKNGILNLPTGEHLENLKLLCAKLEQIRKIVGKPINISSGYRGLKLNKLVGGVSTSAHCQGFAADISVSGLSPKELCDIISKSGIEYDQCILEFNRWTHFGLRKNNMRRENLTAKTINGKTVYLQGFK